MQNIEVKELEECKIEVMYEVGTDVINEKRNEVLIQFKDAPCKGFRKSKANLEVIKIQYRKQIDEALKRALAEKAYHDTLFEKEIKPFGMPQFKNILLESNKFTCEFSMFKKPDFELATYKDLEIPKQVIGFTTTELAQQFLQESRTRYGESVSFTDEDFVVSGDNVIIDYKAFLPDSNGVDQELTNLGATGELLTIGKSKLIGFDDNLLGMKIGDTREFSLSIPETGLPSIANKMVKFSATLTGGAKVIPMPLGDELAKKMGKETLQELEVLMSEAATAKVAEAERLALVNQLTARLIDDNEFEVPHWLSLSEAQYLANGAKLVWDTLADEDKVKYLSMAENNVRLALILDRIREEEIETQMTDQEVLELIRQTVAKTNPDNTDEVMTQMNQSGYLTVLVARVRDEQVLDYVLKQAKILE